MATSAQYSYPKYHQQGGSYMSFPGSSAYPHAHSSTRPSEMSLPSDQPTPEKTVMASSCSKVQTFYKEIIAKEKEYEACHGPYIGNLKDEDFFEWEPQRVQRLEIEGQFLALALEVQKLNQQRARGAEFLKEKICDIAPTIIVTLEVDIAHLEHYLKTSTSSQLREKHASLVRRVNQFAAMAKLFGRSEFTLSSGRVCSFPSGATMLNYKVNALEHKLPDSEFVQGLKSFAKGVSDFFTPSPSPQSTYILTPYSDSLREKDKNLEAWVTMNRLNDGYTRQLNTVRHGHSWQ